MTSPPSRPHKVVVEYVPTLADHVEAWRLFNRNRGFLRIERGFGILFALVAAYLLAVPGWNAVAVGFAVFAVMALTDWEPITRIQLRTAFRNQERLSEAHRLEISEESIEFSTPTVESSVRWDVYSRLLEGAAVYLLVIGRGQYSVIPKRGFSGEADRDAFAAIARSRLPDR